MVNVTLKLTLDVTMLLLFTCYQLIGATQLRHQKRNSKDILLGNRKPYKNSNKDIPLNNDQIVVELMIVVDKTAYDYHGNDTEHYVITVMNIVQQLWNSPKFKANITLQINEMLILEQQPVGLNPVDDATIYLKRYCSWQKRRFSKQSVSYDTTLLITRTNLHIHDKYEATGIGYIYGACDIEHRCSVNEDTYPMGLAMTIAHEIGHNLGMWHDGFHDGCPDRVNLMSGYSTGGPLSLTWSHCSIESVNTFLRSSKSSCLKNRSQEATINLVDQAPAGFIYDADYQCRMLYGAEARDCTNWTHDVNKCGQLKCYRDLRSRSCETEKRPPLDGTNCGPNSICLSGYCQVYNHSVASVDWKVNRQSLQQLLRMKEQAQPGNNAPLIGHEDGHETKPNNDNNHSNLRIQYVLLLLMSVSCSLVIILRLRTTLRKRRKYKRFII